MTPRKIGDNDAATLVPGLMPGRMSELQHTTLKNQKTRERALTGTLIWWALLMNERF
jgi:hypothetical protein